MVSQASSMSTASIESSSAVSDTNMEYPNYLTGESSTQRTNDSDEPVTYSRTTGHLNTVNLKPFTVKMYQIFAKCSVYGYLYNEIVKSDRKLLSLTWLYGASNAMKTELIHHMNDNLLDKLDEQKRKELCGKIPLSGYHQ
ncbi:hypothetical protein G6F56_007695 [Rhizopus delemar]|nr:hypothetical protein G6F56_007695 [Rhizopus delemar]